MGAMLTGKVAIVTGSSSGIGRATALRLAREGAAVCGVAERNVRGGEATAEEVRQSGGQSLFVRADVRLGEDCARVAEAALQAFGRIDVLVNNAGITRSSPLAEMDEAFWDMVMDTNLKSAYLMSRTAVADMLRRGRGSVVNISSVHAVASRPGHAAYAASKAGLCGMTRALACEYGPLGVRFNCVLPGTIDLSLHPRSLQPVDRQAWTPRASDVQIMKRLGSPDEVASVVCFLASEESSFVNGATLTVDGGLLAMLKDR
jgi:NAD(P)-dependent dehydrogenase (short-subunit alcohol dehydrogenase family)